MREVFREVASLVIYNPTLDKLLVQDRTSISKYGEEVTFFGGGLDEGETPLQAAKRESDEELGTSFDHYEYLGKIIHDRGGKDYIRHLFFVITQQERFNDTEGDGGIWLSMDGMEQKKFPAEMTQGFTTIRKHLESNKKR